MRTKDERPLGPVHARRPRRRGPPRVHGPVVNPIVLSTTFYSEPDGDGGALPALRQRPQPRVALEERLAALEGTEDAVVLASGMAAMVCAVISVLAVGDHVVATDAIYGGTRALLEKELPRLGHRPPPSWTSPRPGWTAAMRPNTKLVIGESPSNPLLRVLDLRAISDEAHARGAVVVCDCTFASPVNLRAAGARGGPGDAQRHQVPGGHTDVTAGVIAGSRRAWARCATGRRCGGRRWTRTRRGCWSGG
jgi:cystathionine beta-lyase/cystathionine gamma-synthase